MLWQQLTGPISNADDEQCTRAQILRWYEDGFVKEAGIDLEGETRFTGQVRVINLHWQLTPFVRTCLFEAGILSGQR